MEPPIVSATTLKAVAAAADGHRTGADSYIVASEDELDELMVFESEAEAEAYRSMRSGSWWVYGPYRTATSGGTPYLPTSVRLYFADGSEELVTPDEVEAVFLSEAAIDRFLIPYYTRVRGVEYAAALREDFLAGVRRVCCKSPRSVTKAAAGGGSGSAS